MKIKDCGGCGNCQDFIQDKKCPVDAFYEEGNRGYKTANIKHDLCINCGICLNQIDCLCEAIQEN
jgi:NAD-dependent dihydropyrimidine dehydrogenase PreA subunit